ncbi:DegT/DnrJ/EryC1/StrS family aminotransferase [Leeuwenhoekiella palythoae]|uniref:DegT/DnrJ/EryC1/StrS family aminotransferase n=1 Tax=Leeuwenhoekiella palythoae TaxID=573501 RepID=UPI0035126E48
MIPFLDLKKLNAPYKEVLTAAFKNTLHKGDYILGDAVTRFENEFANYCGTEYCIGTGNGLDALQLIFEGYKYLGKLNEGDEVLLAANSYIATVLAVIHSGLKPVFIEIETSTFNIDFEQLPEPDSSIKAILITHLYGQLGPVTAVVAYAQKHNLLFIEDAAQAHGATFNTKKAGNFGDAAAFSFYPTKNLGALGDGGAVTSNDETLMTVIKSLRNYGRTSFTENSYTGFNSRLDTLQAAFLSEKLKHLNAENLQRRAIATRYLAEIINPQITLPFWDDSAQHVFHLFVVLVENRDHFLSYLKNSEVGFGVHYAIPPYQQKALKTYNHLNFPLTEKVAQTCVSIPLNPTLNAEEVTQIISVLNQYNA